MVDPHNTGAPLIATIDTGTSNTRVCVWRNDSASAQAQAAASRPVGVRDTVLTGSRAALQQAVRQALLEGLAKIGATENDLTLVLASGMITSPAGLHELPHLAAPAGAAELAEGMVQASVPEVCTLPIWWVPGVRNVAASDTSRANVALIEALDMMRGEETETIALIDRLGWQGAGTLVLPGSHTKFVRVDPAGRITACATTLAGELLHALSTHTLLASSLNTPANTSDSAPPGTAFAQTLDLAALEAGAEAAGRVGLARAGFSVRALDVFGAADRNARANYLLGAVLASDVLALQHSQALGGLSTGAVPRVHVAGRPLVRDALCHLLRRALPAGAEVHAIADAQQADMAGWGAILLARRRGLLAADAADSVAAA